MVRSKEYIMTADTGLNGGELPAYDAASGENAAGGGKSASEACEAQSSAAGGEKSVMVAMSGGVDSSVSLLMLKQAGYQCMGITMKLVEKNEELTPENRKSDAKDFAAEGAENAENAESRDIADARKVAESLDVPFRVVDLCEMFRDKVIEPFACAYERGETPNPCVYCNKEIKFGYLHELRKKLGADFLATGHYARIVYSDEDGYFLLKKAADSKKDQSYFLYQLTQEQLAHTLFPMSDIIKEDARRLAEEEDIITSRKRESQDICFVPDGKYAEVIRRHRLMSADEYRGPCGDVSSSEDEKPGGDVISSSEDEKSGVGISDGDSKTTGDTSLRAFEPGEFIDKEGNVLGTHKGIINYTVGQRKGLGLSLKKPGYICKIDVKNNRIVIGDNEDLFTREFDVKDVNLISCERLSEYKVRNGASAAESTSGTGIETAGGAGSDAGCETVGGAGSDASCDTAGGTVSGTGIDASGIRLNVRIRYNQKEQPATVIQTAPDMLHVIYDEPQRAITSGQAAVLYDGDIVVGGGIIINN